jgi:uncharacterized protein
MQNAITLGHNGMTLRGMEHIPETTEKVPALIIFHGYTGSKLGAHRMFLKMSRALENFGIASFRFDFLGSGESDGDFEDMTVSGELADANAMLDFVKNDPRIDEDRVMVLGHSMGGLVASLLAGDRPEDVYKLILMAPAGTMYEMVKEMAAQVQAAGLTRFDDAGNVVGMQFSEDLKTIDVFNRAEQYKGDVLIIHGIKDETVPYQVANLYQEKSYKGRAAIHFIEEADHSFNKYEWEQEVIETVCGFTKGV